MITVHDAILSLRPGAAWVLYDENVENIVWHTEGVAPLTRAEVDAEVARLEQAAVAEAAAKEAARASAVAKLAALGLDESEVAALIGGSL